VHEGDLSLRVPVTGAFTAVLRDLRGNRIAVFRGAGPLDNSFSLGGLPAGFAVLDVRGKGITFRELIEIR
jgi:hypothetical protein